jgi:glucosamine kinase
MTRVREAFFGGLKAAAPQMPILETAVVSLDGAVWRAKRLAESQ